MNSKNFKKKPSGSTRRFKNRKNSPKIFSSEESKKYGIIIVQRNVGGKIYLKNFKRTKGFVVRFFYLF